MKLSRARTLTGALLLALLACVVSAAHAAAATSHGTIVALPPAPKIARAAATVTLAAAAPTISPSDSSPSWLAPDVEYLDPYASYYYCPNETLCAEVWDPSRNQWKIFHLYYCHTYSLANWHSLGNYADYQIPKTVSYFFDQYWNRIVTLVAANQYHNYNWDPIWYIQNC